MFYKFLFQKYVRAENTGHGHTLIDWTKTWVDELPVISSIPISDESRFKDKPKGWPIMPTGQHYLSDDYTTFAHSECSWGMNYADPDGPDNTIEQVNDAKCDEMGHTIEPSNLIPEHRGESHA